MKPIIDFFFGIEQNFDHSSIIMAGMDLLARRKLIQLRFKRPQSDEYYLIKNPDVICFKLYSRSSSAPLVFAVDLTDHSDSFDPMILANCDFYLMKNFYQPSLGSIPVELANKVRPYGLLYPCRTKGSSLCLFSSIVREINRVRSSCIRSLYAHQHLPTINDYEQAPSVSVDSTIVYQTRVWEDYDAPEESEIINEQRVAVIRALKYAFGDRFRGGLVPSSLALRRYPNEVSQYQARRKLYTAMSKRNLIAVYTRGLNSSTAWKLAEYLAASHCIVAEQWRNELPTPLVNGTHYLSFQTPDQCVAMCQKILESPELSIQMRQANYDYYKTEVEPSAGVLNVLKRYGGISL